MQPIEHVMSTDQKALALNLDPLCYGSFAEIGAGQEVVRHFFRVGGAAATVAKSISAYDMKFSDAIYGRESNGRYVCQSRVQHMLAHEYDLLIERLWEHRATQSRFFVFANTVAARSFSNTKNCHGWMGIRFQHTPEAEYNQLIIHVRLLDNDVHMQQQVLGIIGVNLMHTAFYNYDDPDRMLRELTDNISDDRIEIDLIEATGPIFEEIDNRIISLKLVEFNYTDAIIFDTAGYIEQAADALYKKPILIQRGSFCPVTHVSMNMQDCAQKQFLNEKDLAEDRPCTLMEISLHNLTAEQFGHTDFLDRITLLNAMGYKVMVSNFKEYHRLSRYIRAYTKKLLVLTLGINELKELMDPNTYEADEDSVFEVLAEIIGQHGKLYVYPALNEKDQNLITSQNLQIDQSLQGLLDYCRHNNFIHDLIDCDTSTLHIYSKQVLEHIKDNNPQWETMVPAQVADIIKTKKLWQHKTD